MGAINMSPQNIRVGKPHQSIGYVDGYEEYTITIYGVTMYFIVKRISPKQCYRDVQKCYLQFI